MLLKYKTKYSFQINQDRSEKIMTRLVYYLRKKNFTVSNKDEQTLFISSEYKMGFEGWIKFKYKEGQFDISFEITQYALFAVWMVLLMINMIVIFESDLSFTSNAFLFFLLHSVMYLTYRTNISASANKVIDIFKRSIKV
jgi:hypothetical protein